ncbi:MAG: MgtC/SapB family protein [Bacteroidota bacterium]|nr:MgtC/SapB family protein [Bacteroidota bacterium]
MDQLIIDTPSFQVSQADFFIRLLVATGIGFLVGLEREHDIIIHKEQSFAGIRTFVFVALIGFIGACINYLFSPWAYFAVIAGMIALVLFSYHITASRGDIGSTTELSAIIVFFLGGLAFAGLIEISLMITVVLVVFLSSKLKLRKAIGTITPEELYDLIRFIVVALLIFPFLPDQNYGPYQVLNPREIGWVILLTSGLGFFGYMLMKFIGAGRGILLTGIIGGFVSSTAVTWVFAKKSKQTPALSIHCATAILVASSIMIVRVLVWVAVFKSTLIPSLIIPFGFIFLVAIGISVYFFIRQSREKIENVELPKGKPLDLKGALVFGFIYVVITLVVSYANEQFGESGILVSSAIASLSDIDAITISVSKLAGDSLSVQIALIAILIATVSNTIVKMGIGFWAGSHQLRKYLILGYGAIFAAGVLAYFLLKVKF